MDVDVNLDGLYTDKKLLSDGITEILGSWDCLKENEDLSGVYCVLLTDFLSLISLILYFGDYDFYC